MKNKEKLIKLFEKFKGHKKEMFDNEEWAEFDAFCYGYLLSTQPPKTK